jgi:hypothetical protein
MPLQRLRRVLEANYRVRIESTDDLVAIVNGRVEKRRRACPAKGACPCCPSFPSVYGASKTGTLSAHMCGGDKILLGI